MEDTIGRIIRIEDRAQEIAKEAEEKQASLADEIEKSVAEIQKDVAQKLSQKREEIKKSEEEFTKKRIEDIKRKYKDASDYLDKRYRDMEDEWVLDILNAVKDIK